MRYRDVYKRLNGREPTTQETQKFQILMDTLETTPGDAMLSILVALDHYEVLYNEIPKRIQDATESAAVHAAHTATAELTRAVASLVPSVRKAVTENAATAIRRITLGRSVIEMWMAVLTLGLMFGCGWVVGSGVLGHLQDGSLKTSDFWRLTGSGIGIGIAAPACLIVALYAGEDQRTLAVGSAWCASLMGATLALKVLGLF